MLEGESDDNVTLETVSRYFNEMLLNGCSSSEIIATAKRFYEAVEGMPSGGGDVASPLLEINAQVEQSRATSAKALTGLVDRAEEFLGGEPLVQSAGGDAENDVVALAKACAKVPVQSTDASLR